VRQRSSSILQLCRGDREDEAHKNRNDLFLLNKPISRCNIPLQQRLHYHEEIKLPYPIWEAKKFVSRAYSEKENVGIIKPLLSRPACMCKMFLRKPSAKRNHNQKFSVSHRRAVRPYGYQLSVATMLNSLG